MLMSFGLIEPAFFLTNIRGWPVVLLRSSSTFLYSRDGVTQGDRLSMFMYAELTFDLFLGIGHN